jgi:hypothetical protein
MSSGPKPEVALHVFFPYSTKARLHFILVQMKPGVFTICRDYRAFKFFLSMQKCLQFSNELFIDAEGTSGIILVYEERYKDVRRVAKVKTRTFDGMGQLHKSPRKVRSWFGTLDLLTVANNQCS